MIFAAIDWAEQTHTLVVLDAEGGTLERARIEHSHLGLVELDRLLQKHADSPEDVAVAIELNEGLLLDWLLDKDKGYRVYGINPKSAERARDRYTPASLKDDDRDAWALAEFLRTSYQHLRPMRQESDKTVPLRAWVRLREDLVQERTVQLQRLRSHLVTWNPHFLRAISDLNAKWTLDVLDQTPTADEFAELTTKKIDTFARGRRMRLVTRDRVLTQATFHSPTLQSVRNKAHALEVRHRVQTIRHLNEQIAQIDKTLEDLIDEHPDASIFRSLPVTGTVTTATFLAAFGEDRERWDGHEELAARWGAAPVTQQSGKHRTVKRRMARDTTVHQGWLWFAFNTVCQEGCWAREYYREKRKTGTDHYTALRCTAQRWIKIIYRLWHDRIPYNEEIHQARRKERQAPRT
ncbi:MAG: IS110 family transposase [Candidatus Binatia bacterium]